MDNEPILPSGENTPEASMSAASRTAPLGTPSPKAQSWGALISIIIIVLMIVIGAFYSWGKRIAETNVPAEPSTVQ